MKNTHLDLYSQGISAPSSHISSESVGRTKEERVFGRAPPRV
jgi:hypothetical protein